MIIFPFPQFYPHRSVSPFCWHGSNQRPGHPGLETHHTFLIYTIIHMTIDGNKIENCAISKIILQRDMDSIRRSLGTCPQHNVLFNEWVPSYFLFIQIKFNKFWNEAEQKGIHNSGKEKTWNLLEAKRDKMTKLTEFCRSDKLCCQHGDRNYKKKYNKHHKRMWWQKDISSLYRRKLTTVSCGSFCVSGDYCLGLYNYHGNGLNYSHNGKSSSSSSSWMFFLKKMFFVFLWLSCCCLCPSSCDQLRGKE